jgi:hypothetical protein
MQTSLNLQVNGTESRKKFQVWCEYHSKMCARDENIEQPCIGLAASWADNNLRCKISLLSSIKLDTNGTEQNVTYSHDQVAEEMARSLPDSIKIIIFLGSKVRRVSKTDNLTAIYEPIV